MYDLTLAPVTFDWFRLTAGRVQTEGLRIAYALGDLGLAAVVGAALGALIAVALHQLAVHTRGLGTARRRPHPVGAA
jgi:hypothetical protein